MEARILDQLTRAGDADFRSYWRTRPGVFPNSGIRSPFTLTDLDAALASGFFREPYLEMWRDGKRLPVKEFTESRTVARETPAGFADGARVHSLLDDGATILLRCVEQWHGPTRRMLHALADELGLPVEAFYFVTPEGRPGLPLHRDDGDVLVVQVAGSKSWCVHEGPADGEWYAGRVQPHEPQPAELFRTVLHPGDVLYIPRGFAHHATGRDGLSAHLSLAIREIGVADLSDTVRERVLRDAEAETADTGPRPLSEDAITAAAKTLLDHARRQLAELTADALVAHARQRRMDRMPVEPPNLSLSDMASAWPARDGERGRQG
ncbi:hypothetical protein ACZ90_13090 [Streptomyces albus subsp. albus]|nr:hypothetical protein ACZ90_13090 [Streptomyces albus subsp. albus]